MWYINKRDAIYIVLFHSSPGAIPASMMQTSITTPTPVILVTIPTPIPTLFL